MGKSWELREVEAKAGGGQDSVFGVLLQEEGRAAGDRSEESLGRQEAYTGQSSSGSWVEGQTFLAVGFWKALSPPEPVSSMGGQKISSPLCWAEEQSKQRHLGERILNSPHLLPLPKQRAPCDWLQRPTPSGQWLQILWHYVGGFWKSGPFFLSGPIFQHPLHSQEYPLLMLV